MFDHDHPSQPIMYSHGGHLALTDSLMLQQHPENKKKGGRNKWGKKKQITKFNSNDINNINHAIILTASTINMFFLHTNEPLF